jgi:hypothetical protein
VKEESEADRTFCVLTLTVKMTEVTHRQVCTMSLAAKRHSQEYCYSSIYRFC